VNQFSTGGYGVAYSLQQTKWIAVGQGTNSAVSSSDGIIWAAIPSLNSVLTTDGYAIAWSVNQSQWVAVGSGASFKIATSPDGITWTGRSSPFGNYVLGIAYSPALNIWVAAGQTTTEIASSPDGVTWTQRLASVNSILGRRVIWAPELGLFVATLKGGPAGSVTTSTSADGITWVSEAIVFQTAAIASGLAWNGTTLMIAGQGTSDTLATSVNAISYVGLGKTVFTSSGNDVCYGVDYGRWVFGGFGGVSHYSLTAATGTTTSSLVYSGGGNGCAARYTS
jgi:hypothetical protein